MRSIFIILLQAGMIILFTMSCRAEKPIKERASITYFIDSNNGSDSNSGASENAAWQSLKNFRQGILQAGDSIRFKRGSAFIGPLIIFDSGTPDHPIVLTDYGDASLPAPSFTNPVFELNNYGNCIRIKGNAVIVENLYFHSTSSYKRGSHTPTNSWDVTVWEMGAVYIDKNASGCIVRNNEFEDCVVGIKSYGPNMLAENNYLHDCNRVLKEWGWGPIGIWFGGDHQEARFNTIINYRAEDPRITWHNGTGGGADGGAFEIDDARYDKSNISIHHNYTRDCQGFLEVTWTDIQQHPVYKDFRIHHNISDDYQQFIALWDGENCFIENNTIVRRKKNANDWGVFNITQERSHNLIRNNIIITEKDIQIFNTGLNAPKHPENIIENNLYYAASGSLIIGNEGPGANAVYGDPLLTNYTLASKPADYSIRAGSPAINKGMDLGYKKDFDQATIPSEGSPDIGAFEYSR